MVTGVTDGPAVSVSVIGNAQPNQLLESEMDALLLGRTKVCWLLLLPFPIVCISRFRRTTLDPIWFAPLPFRTEAVSGFLTRKASLNVFS